MNIPTIDIRMFLPQKPSSREDLIPLLDELHHGIDRIRELLDEAFAETLELETAESA